eukprot:scaffold310573_cov32-Tisochrysis_lutea.AAC.3
MGFAHLCAPWMMDAAKAVHIFFVLARPSRLALVALPNGTEPSSVPEVLGRACADDKNRWFR